MIESSKRAATLSAAARAWAAVDWVPARTTAIAFAVVGSFEEAIGPVVTVVFVAFMIWRAVTRAGRRGS